MMRLRTFPKVLAVARFRSQLPTSSGRSSSSAPAIVAGSDMSAEQRARVLPPAFWRDMNVTRTEQSGGKLLCADRQAGILVDALLPTSERVILEEGHPMIDFELDIAATHGAFLDRLVTDAVGNRIKQVVLVGSGMDSRAYRLDLKPQLTIFEVDEEGVHSAKHKAFTEAGERSRCSLQRIVAPDGFALSAEMPTGALSDALDIQKPSLFLLDNGIFTSWPESVHKSALSALFEAAAEGSRIVVQVRAHASASGAVVRAPTAADSARAALEEVGWARTDVVGDKALRRLFHRAPPDLLALLVVGERGQGLVAKPPVPGQSSGTSGRAREVSI